MPTPQERKPDYAAGNAAMLCREMPLSADTIDLENRSIGGVFATEGPARVFDWNRGGMILEVLQAAGGDLPANVPLLDCHNRMTVDDQLGSARGAAVVGATVQGRGATVQGRVFFADDGPQGKAQRTWQKVVQRHLNALSAGYRAMESFKVPAGQSGIVNGTTYTAGEEDLWVTSRWQLLEVSVLPIGADEKARMRSEAGGPAPALLSHHQNANPDRALAHNPALERSMNETLRNILDELGLRQGADVTEAWTFYRTMEPGKHGERLRTALGTDTVPDPAPVTTRAAPAPAPKAAAGGDDAASPAAGTIPDPVAAERLRTASILELGTRHAVPQDLVTRAISLGLSPVDAGGMFEGVAQWRAGRVPADAGQAGPAIHSRSHERDCTREALAAGFMISRGLDPTRHTARFTRAGVYEPWRESEDRSHLARHAEMGHQFRDMALVDVAREALRIDCQRTGEPMAFSRTEIVTRAFAGGTLSNIFSTSVYASLMKSYTEGADTTRLGWCSETDVDNFMENELIGMDVDARMTKHKRGGAAEQASASDKKEVFRISRYSKQWTIDEMDVLDGRFGALNVIPPEAIGAGARAVRPDLVFGLLHYNSRLGPLMRDGIDLFNAAAHGNYWVHADSALSATAIQAAISAMGEQRLPNNSTSNIVPRYLIVPQQLQWVAKIELASPFRMAASLGGVANPLLDEQIVPIVDSRMGPLGCVDPSTGVAATGLATNWLLSARPGEGNAQTIIVAYLRGTGRAPMLRSKVLDSGGTWGLNIDCKLDIGVKAADWPCLYKSKGAA
jgi:hypothetical protein